MFGNADALIQIDMSEYAEKHNVSRLIGRAAGLTSATRRAASSPRKIRRRLYWSSSWTRSRRPTPTSTTTCSLQIMEEGRLTDSFGRMVDFKNTIIIKDDQRRRRDDLDVEVVRLQRLVRRREVVREDEEEDFLGGSIEKYFRPEFLNRLDDLIVFHSLTRDNLRQIIDIEAATRRGLKYRLRDRGLELVLTGDSEELPHRPRLSTPSTAPDASAGRSRTLIEDPLS